MTLLGCGAPAGMSPGGGGTETPLEDGNQDQGATSPSGKTRGEPNDSFGQAMFAVFDADGAAQLQGTVDTAADLDVFALTAVVPGDRLIVDVSTPDGRLDSSIALFDEQGRIVDDNDDRDSGPDPLDAFVDHIVRHAGDPYFLVVGHSAFAASTARTGPYRVSVTIEHDLSVPPPQMQTVVLDFDGGAVTADTLPVSFVMPFDASRIDPRYSGQTEQLKRLITERVRSNYERFDVMILTSDDPAPPRPFTSLLLGGFNAQAFGISESVDHYDVDRCDDGIIFTESFNPAFFSRPPTTEEMGRAIGNVASHELGHLLGLNHVTDPTAIMDGASPADTFILDQRFKQAPLSRDILRIGTQDDPLLLGEIVGLR